MTVDNLKLKYSKNSTLGKFIKQFEAEKDLNLDEFFNLLFETYLTKRYLVDIVDFVNSYEILLNFVKAKTYFLDNYYPEINTGQRLYHLYSKDYKVYFCPICNKPLKWKKGRKFDTFYNDFKNNYYLHCGTKICSWKVNYINTLAAIKEKYNEPEITNISQTKLWHDKIKASNLETYGVEWQTQSDNFKSKAKETCLEKYGVEHHLQNTEILNKQKETNKERYGVSWFTQTDKCQLTNNNWKWYNLPSRNKVHIQGYENKFLDEYFSSNGSESNLCIEAESINKEIGMIWYNTPDGKKHRYFPDFYLINENKIIEVKSQWTYNVAKEVNELKKEACLAMGLNFEFKIY